MGKGKGLKWPIEAFQKKGLVQNAAGDFVKVGTLVAKGKVEKIKLPPDYLILGKIGILKQDGTVEPLDTKIDFTADKERAYDGSNHRMMELDEISQVAIPIKGFEHLSYIGFESKGNLVLPNREHEVIHPKFIFDLAPCPAPRMSRSDKWKTDPYHPDPTKRQRVPVAKYFKFRNALQAECVINGYTLTERIQLLCIIPMSESWSKKKKAALDGQPHKLKGDWDNLGKAFCDALAGEDNFVWDGRIVKIWGYTGKIIVF